MPSTPWIPQVPVVEDGQPVSAAVVNPVTEALAQRTQHLYERFASVAANRSVLTSIDEPVASGSGVVQYSTVYFDKISNGLALAQPQLVQDGGQIHPSVTSFVYGIVKSVSGSRADIWLQGLIQENGILTALLDGAALDSGMTSGPLYLSSTERGKLTFDPSGFVIYVGFAKNSNTILLNPSFESANSLFQTFKFMLLDRPAGEPQLNDDVWSISTPDLSVVGWIPVYVDGSIPTTISNYLASNGIIVPSDEWNAQPAFFYNIPSEQEIDADVALHDNEKLVAKYLKRAFPPSPTQMAMLYRNGVLQMSRYDGMTEQMETTTTTSTTSSTTTPPPDWYVTSDGLYHVTKDGIWWYNNTTNVPWATDLPTEGYAEAADWLTIKGSEQLRPRLMLIFSRLNPDVRSSLVTSLDTYKDSSNDTGSVIQMLSASGEPIDATTGDLYLKFELGIATALAEAVKSGQAIKRISYNSITGKLEPTTGSVISDIRGAGTIRVTTDSTGTALITSAAGAAPTALASLEPENSRLELVSGLNTSLTLDATNLPCGFLGKIVLPDELLTGWDLLVRLVYFGKTSVSPSQTVKLQFNYNIATLNSVMPTGTGTSSTVTLALGANYVANTSKLSDSAVLRIPAAVLVPNSIVNFRVTRNDLTGSSTYQHAVGITAVYWHFVQ